MKSYDYENYFNRKDKYEHAIRKAKIDERYLAGLKDVPTLNIGAGIIARHQTPHISKIVCGDISQKNVDNLKKDGFEAICFDAREHWPFPDHSFEQIIAIDVFEHLGQVTSFIEELSRVVQPGGMVVIATPLLNNWRNYLKLVSMTTEGVQYDEHPRMFFDKDIKRLFTEHRFILKRTHFLGLKGYGYYHFYAPQQ